MKLIPIKERKRFNGKMTYGVAKYLKGNELRLYIMLTEYHNNKYDYAFPTYEEIRTYFDKSWDNKNIRKYITGLEDKGFIKIGKHRNRGGYDNNTYEVFGVESEYDIFECNEDIKALRVKITLLEGERNGYAKGLEKYKGNVGHTIYLESEVERVNFEIEEFTKEIEEIKKSLELGLQEI